VLVVDDRSTDGTAELARAHGARVIEGAELPAGWIGKSWAMQQGLEVATGDWVIFLDADTRPRPGLVAALVEAAGPYDLLSAAPRFVCESAAERMLHPAMAATLPYRLGPLDVEDWQPTPRRALANGQCVVVRREPFLASGGWGRVAGNLSEDVALARSLRADGARVGFADAADLLEVRMYASARETWTGWGRSLMGSGATAPLQQAGDVALLWLTLALPLPRLVSRRGTPLDAMLVAVRLAIHVALARGYAKPRGLPYALAPLADLPVTAWLTWSALRPSRRWRGRTYDAAAARGASAAAPGS
jgi:dolichol-phosphate mannosyltransferase